MSGTSVLKGLNRLSRRAFLAAALVAVLLAAGGGERAAASDDPAIAFVRSLGDDVIAVLTDKTGSTFAEREAAFREVMIRGFDVPTVTRFVLGRHWKAATDEQRKEFSAILLDFLVRVYTVRFDADAYGSEHFAVLSAIADESGDTIVRSQVVRPSGAPSIALDFRIRPKKGSYKVIDLHVEGISMLHTHRVEFGSVVNREGIDGLLSGIRARLEAPVGDAAE